MLLTNGSNSPLRYPGGKGKITKFVGNVLDLNNIGGTYIEPYAGGSGIAINLLIANKVEKIVINDLDPHVFSFWKAVTQQPSKLIDLIQKVPFDFYDHAESLSSQERFSYWLDVKNSLENSINGNSDVNEAFYFFMMNRMNRSGVIKGGAIGGTKQDGEYNISSRFNKEKLINKIKKISSMSNKISVTNLEASEVIEKFSVGFFGDVENSLLFVDPPYYEQGKSLYNSYATSSIHETTAQKLLDNLDQNWILTYDTAPQINQLYPDKLINKFEYGINYSAQKRGKFNEYMFTSPNLNICSFDNVDLKSV